MNAVARLAAVCVLGGMLLLPLLLPTGGASAEAPALVPAKAPVVVELFTSQGCSSCPPADAALGELARRADVIALSLPITIWDYLGWKDTLATRDNTLRQRAYAGALGLASVYTPQAIIDGRLDVIASRRTELDLAILARGADRTQPIAVRLARVGESVTIEIGAAVAGAGEQAGERAGVVWLLRYRDANPVRIRRGENAGREITYVNAVDEIREAGRWTGAALKLTLPAMAAPGLGYVTLLQAGEGYGPILGADALKP